MPKIIVLPHEKICPQGAELKLKVEVIYVEVYWIMAFPSNMPAIYQVHVQHAILS